MNKKRIILSASIFLLVIISIYLVSAARSPTEDLKSLVRGAGEVLSTLFETILGPGPAGVEGSGLFARALFLAVIFVVVWLIVKKIPLFQDKEHEWARVVLSLAVALLSTRFLLEEGWVETILLPYSTFGIAITSLIPLILYFYFVYKGIRSKTLRRVAWIVAAVVFIGLWFTRRGELQNIATWVYPTIIAACIALFIFDGSIKRIWQRIEHEQSISASKMIVNQKTINDLWDKIEDARKAQGRATAQSSIDKQQKLIDLWTKQIEDLEATGEK